MNDLNAQAQTQLAYLKQREMLAQADTERRLKEGREDRPKLPLLARLGLLKPAKTAVPVRA